MGLSTQLYVMKCRHVNLGESPAVARHQWVLRRLDDSFNAHPLEGQAIDIRLVNQKRRTQDDLSFPDLQRPEPPDIDRSCVGRNPSSGVEPT